MEKYFFRVHVEQVRSHDSGTAPSLDNEVTQPTSQSGDVTQSQIPIELVQSLGSRESGQAQNLDEEEDSTTSHTCQGGTLTVAASNDATQTIEQPAQRSHSGEPQRNASIQTIRPSCTPTNAPIDETNDRNFPTIVSIQKKDPADAELAEHPDIAKLGTSEDTPRSLGIEEHAIRLSIKSSRIYSPENGVYVGLLHELPPPDVLEKGWYSIRKKLWTDLITASRRSKTLPRPVKGSEPFRFEPEFCMSGRALPNTQDVLLKPTIWISCRSPQYQRFIEEAIRDVDCNRRFPVHVTQHAPQPASLRLDTGESPYPEGESDEMQYYEMSSGIQEEDDYMRGSGDRIEVRVQSSSSKHHSACGLEIKIRVASGVEFACRLGGLISVNGMILGLTTAHAIPKPSQGDNLHLAVSNNESLFIFDSKSEAHGISPESPSDVLVSTTTWFPATLWLAGYGTSPSSPTPSVQGSSHSSVTLYEDMCDFALLQIDFGDHKKPGNSYRKQIGVQSVERESNDLKERAVDLVCSYDDVRLGWLLAGERIIVSDSDCWKTRKIQLKEPLDRGFSGTSVVSGGEALGMIVAVYDNQPYVHMIPMASAFPSIRSALRERSENPEVRILSTLDNMAPALEQSTVQPDVVSVTTISTHRISLPLSEDRPAAKSEKEKKDDVFRPECVTDSLPRMESLLHMVRRLPKGLFVPMCLMVLAIGLDASAFPLIMPSITDNLGSTNTIGWFGSVYFLALGATFPLFHNLYPAISRMSSKRGTIYTLLSVSLVFEGGSFCCYFASSNTLLLCGRVLCGISAAGVMSGAAFTVKELSPPEGGSQRIRNGCLLTTYALSHFLGLIFGSVATDSASTERAWRYVFVISLSAMALPIATLLICLTSYGGWNVAYSPPTLETSNPPGGFRLYQAMFFISSILLTGAAVCLQLVMHYVALNDRNYTLEISLTSSATVILLAIFFAQRWSCRRRSYRHYGHAGYSYSRNWQKTTTILLLSFSWGASYHTFAYYLPLWLRAARGYSVLQTVRCSLPIASVYIFASVFKAILFVLRKRPWAWKLYMLEIRHASMLSSLAFMTLGSGLMTRFNDNTPTSTVVGLQTLFSAAAGWGALQATAMDPLATLRAFNEDQAPFEQGMTWYSLAVISEMLGGSLGISAAQTVFMRLLSRGANQSDLVLDDLLRTRHWHYQVQRRTRQRTIGRCCRNFQQCTH